MILAEREVPAAVSWKTVPLSEAVDILDSKRVPVNRTERAKCPGDIPYYGATGQVDWIDDFLFDEELVLLGEDGAPFLEPHKPKAYRIEGKSWVNNHAHVLRAKRGVDSKYLVYYLNTVDYRPFVSGTTRLKLTQAAMRHIPILLPPFDEQAQIVEAIETQFTRLDDAVAALRRARTRLKRYRASLLKAACEGRLVPTEAELARREGRGYESASVLLERIRAEREAAPGTKRGKKQVAPALDTSALPELPEGWTRSHLGQHIAAIEAGKNFKCIERPPGSDEVGVVKISAVSWGAFRERESKTCKAASSLKPNLLIRTGDFLISRANTLELVGACVVVEHVALSLMLSDKVLRVRYESSLLPKWALYFLRSVEGRQAVEERATGNQLSMRNIGQDRIRDIPIPLPPLAEQARIVAEVERRLSVIEQMEATVEANLKRAESLRQSILRLAFSGRLSRSQSEVMV